MTDRELLIECCYRIKALAADVRRVYMPAAARLDPFKDLSEDKTDELVNKWSDRSAPVVMYLVPSWLDDTWLHDAPEEADRILGVLRRNDDVTLPESATT